MNGSKDTRLETGGVSRAYEAARVRHATNEADASLARREMLDRLAEARRQTDGLFELVRPAALVDRPIPERHRTLFYIGHLEAFDWNLIGRTVLGLDPVDEARERLFAFGIDPVGGNLPDDGVDDWPPLDEVRRFAGVLRARIDDCLADPQFLGRAFSSGSRYLHVAIEHRLMHAETLAYMLHHLPGEKKLAPRGAPPTSPVSPAAPPTPRMVEVPAGTATLGLDRRAGQFGWDNEFEQHSVAVPAFRIGAYNITNAEFLRFVLEGGYRERGLWSGEAWSWKEQRGVEHPLFWRRDGGGWLYRAMFAEIPLPGEWPVYVSHAEASAYARWAGKELPTEAQFHRAAYGTPQGTERAYSWGDDPPSAGHGNFDFQSWSPAPVGAHPAGNSAWGVADLLGNGWEWTSTVFGPFPGFERFSFYPGYSADFFDGKHYVQKGGSSRTAACFLRRSFRNWFQPHYPYTYAGFRLVEN